jgi:hypothetical protein
VYALVLNSRQQQILPMQLPFYCATRGALFAASTLRRPLSILTQFNSMVLVFICSRAYIKIYKFQITKAISVKFSQMRLKYLSLLDSLNRSPDRRLEMTKNMSFLQQFSKMMAV